MEVQITSLTDGMATLQDMFSQNVQTHLDDKKQREVELVTIETRFTAQHVQLTAQTDKLADLGKLLVTMQSSLDALGNRIPDDNPSKTRAVEVNGH